jgi:hypothetical protein
MSNETYLGDSVYVGSEVDMVVLTTTSHVRAYADNVIWLEPHVLRQLVEWAPRNDFLPATITRGKTT